MENIELKYIDTNGITLHVALAGPEDGELVILLHGFPEFWYGWRHQIDALSRAGYRVAVPDQRGYNKSDKPRGRTSYRIDILAADIAGLIKSLNREDAFIIGHDWGGAVGWQLASAHPEAVRGFIAVNIPHMGVFPKVFLKAPSQLIRSLYMVFFQIPILPEKIMRSKNYENMAHGIQRTGKEGAFKDSELESYMNAWREPGALIGMLNWYRALPFSLKHIDTHKIDIPVKIIWGDKDPFLSKKLATESLKFIDTNEVIWIHGATHWVHQEEAEVVNKEILNFIGHKNFESGSF